MCFTAGDTGFTWARGKGQSAGTTGLPLREQEKPRGQGGAVWGQGGPCGTKGTLREDGEELIGELPGGTSLSGESFWSSPREGGGLGKRGVGDTRPRAAAAGRPGRQRARPLGAWLLKGGARRGAAPSSAPRLPRPEEAEQAGVPASGENLERAVFPGR